MGQNSQLHPPTPRILVADDEPHVRRILSALLEKSVYDVELVSDGLTAIDRIDGDAPFGLVILDLLMPGATGLEVLDRIRKLDHRRDVPVLILTAKGQDADREEAYARGASDFITKPFSPKKLLGRIDELFQSA